MDSLPFKRLIFLLTIWTPSYLKQLLESFPLTHLPRKIFMILRLLVGILTPQPLANVRQTPTWISHVYVLEDWRETLLRRVEDQRCSE
jgi:hypothetical protein